MSTRSCLNVLFSLHVVRKGAAFVFIWILNGHQTGVQFYSKGCCDCLPLNKWLIGVRWFWQKDVECLLSVMEVKHLKAETVAQENKQTEIQEPVCSTGLPSMHTTHITSGPTNQWRSCYLGNVDMGKQKNKKRKKTWRSDRPQRTCVPPDSQHMAGFNP